MLLLDVGLVVAVVVTGGRLRRLPVDVHREDHVRAQLGREQDVPFRIVNRSRRAVVVRVRQTWPAGLEAEGEVTEVRVAGGEIVRAALAVTPRVRGSVDLPPARFEIRPARFDLARVRRDTPPGRLRVYPSMAGLSAFEALRHHHAANMAGANLHRTLGAGRNFDQVRDYVPDDDFREINWKATARRNRPITNLYRAERSQDVMLCLDCGRMMGDRLAGGTALDHAVDAALMLAHLANRNGDRVGLVLFRDVVTRVLKPAGGLTAVHRMNDELVDARSEPVFPSYAALAAALRTHQARRSFVFLFTDLNDPQLAANLREVLPVITARHAVVVITLRDPLLDRVAGGAAADRDGVYAVLAANAIVQERATRVRELQRMGAAVVEADAGSLTGRSINAYLTTRARQVI